MGCIVENDAVEKETTDTDTETDTVDAIDSGGMAGGHHRHSEAGMTTAEYTVGTLGACSVAAILIKLAHKSIHLQVC